MKYLYFLRKTVMFIIITTSSTLILFSCSKTDESNSSGGSTEIKTYAVKGYVQKGPFVQGTEITVRELDKNLTPTGDTFTGTIDDNTGSFSTKGYLKSSFVELAANGFYFNEVSGVLSTAQLTLQALTDLEDQESVNVNIMTHLERKRAEYLIEQGNSFRDAKAQAQQEILKIFNITSSEVSTSETLDISKDGEGNAILLAISAILQGSNTEAELTELLSTISTNIRTDGILDSTTTQATLRGSAMALNLPAIRSNIEGRYSTLGISASIPKFEDYVDNDGDGIIKREDDDIPDDFNFTDVSNAEFSINYDSKEVEILGLSEGGYVITKLTGDGLLIVNGKESTGEANLKNKDVIKIRVSSSPKYSVKKTAILTIGETMTRRYSVISKTDNRSAIFIFNSGQSKRGVFNRTDANYHKNLCAAEKITQGITGSNVKPFIGTTTLPLKNVFVQDSLNPRKIKSPTGTIIADSWNQIFTGMTNSLSDAGVVTGEWWSGSDEKGEDSRFWTTCIDWKSEYAAPGTTGIAAEYGYVGLGTEKKVGPPSGSSVHHRNCMAIADLLCVAY